MSTQQVLRFAGPAYDPSLDADRLAGQMRRVYDAMSDGVWRTLPEIHDITGDPEASISAQLRHLRKDRFGAHRVDKRRAAWAPGLYEYRLIPSGLAPRPEAWTQRLRKEEATS